MSFVYGQFFPNIELRESTNTPKYALVVLRQMLVSLQVVTALLMSPREPAVDVINRHIKVFLSCCHRFCQRHYTDNTVPFWATISDFSSLLNLAAQIKRYGPIRWYWEGTRERYIQTVKTVLVSMRKTKSYVVRKMVVMQRLTRMAWLEDQMGKKGKRNAHYARNYFRYKTIDEMKEIFKNGEILSGLTIVDNKGATLPGHVWCVYKKEGSELNMTALAMKRNEATGKVLCSMSYHKYLREETYDLGKLCREDIEVAAADYCVLLPYREKHETRSLSVCTVWCSATGMALIVLGKKNLLVLCPREFAVDAKSL